MQTLQPAVLAPVPAVARYLTFSLQPGANPRRALAALAAFTDGESCVSGIGDSVLRALNRPIAGMRAFPSLSGAGLEVPATPTALWCWLRGSDRGTLLIQGRALAQALAPALDAFEAQLRRMVGAEEGIADALFKFTRPVTGAYFWCPPVKRGRLDLSRII